MAGAFSGHLLDTFNASRPQSFGQISTHGPMSFNPQMHGTPSFSNDSKGTSEETMMQIHRLQAKLNQKLGPEYVSQRPGPGGQKLTYAEGWKIINLANEVFGFNGWSSNIVTLTTDYTDFNEESRKYNVGVSAIVRVTLRDGTFHEDVGYGVLENSKTKGPALDKCKKEAVTDALKRSLRNFGNLMGNCLYDKSYTQEVVKIKIQPPKFERDDLHRRPEFETKPPMAVAGPSTVVKSEPINGPPQQTISSVPAHMRSVTTPNAKPSASYSTPPPPYNPASSVRAHPQHQPQPQVQARPQPPPQRPLPPPQQPAKPPQPPQRVASPVDIPNDGDESFSFSDDDAFLAQVDLGEADMGRPIDYEEGTGDVSNLSVSDLSVEHTGAGREDMGPPPVEAKHGQNMRHLQAQQRPSASTSDASTSTSNTANPNQIAPHPHTGNNQSSASTLNTPTNTSVSGSRTGAAPIPQPARQPASNAYGSAPSNQNRAGPGPRPPHNQNMNPPRTTVVPASGAGASSGATKKPAMSSVGGFNFPPGMDPSAGLQQPPQRVSGQPPFSLKRSAEAMSTASATARRPVQGMGLAQHQQQPVLHAKREPFARLDVGEGGAVKRARY